MLIFVLNTAAQDFRYGKVSEEELLEKQHPKDPEVNAAVLYKNQKVYYDYNASNGFTLITEVHERVKIYNKEGFEWATKKLINYKSGSDEVKVSGIDGDTYRLENGKVKSDRLRNNAIFDVDINKYRTSTTFTMPSVVEGSVIEYKYTLRSPFLISINDIPLQYTIPINNLEIGVTIPEFLVFRSHFNPRANLEVKIDRGTKTFRDTNLETVRTGQKHVSHSYKNNKLEFQQNTYSIEKKDIPALIDEDHVGYLNNYAAVLIWELQYTKFPNSAMENYTQTWDGVVKKIYDDPEFGNELGKSKYFESELDELLKNVSLPKDKMSIIFNFVKSKVKWNDYGGYYTDNGVKDAFKDGAGNIADINLMLIAMLKYAGLQADPVLLSTRDNGIPFYPTREGFNYVVAGVSLNNELIYLDGSDKYLEIGMLPYRARNWQGRIIREDKSSEWVNLMGGNTSEKTTSLNIKLDDQFHFEGKITEELDGFFAKTYREDFTDLSNDERIKKLEQSNGKIIISDLEVQNEKEIDKNIKKSFKFELPGGAEEIGNNIYLNPLSFLTITSNPFKSEDRQFPVILKYPTTIINTVNFMLPNNVKVESLPANQAFSINDKDVLFRYVVVQNGNFLRISTELKLNTILYLPEEYEVLKEFYNQIILKNTEKIVLIKT
jgi:transglutaminase-like putative cysteine protease